METIGFGAGARKLTADEREAATTAFALVADLLRREKITYAEIATEALANLLYSEDREDDAVNVPDVLSVDRALDIFIEAAGEFGVTIKPPGGG